MVELEINDPVELMEMNRFMQAIVLLDFNLETNSDLKEMIKNESKFNETYERAILIKALLRKLESRHIAELRNHNNN